MMRLSKYTFIAGVGILIGFVSCSKNFLKETSTDLVRPTTTEALNQLMVGEAYALDNFAFHTYLNLLTDDVQANYTADNSQVITALNAWSPAFLWQPDMFELMPARGATTGTISWTSYYQKIKGCNIALDYLDKVTGLTADKMNIKGQALALRAFYYLTLVNLYGKPYTDAGSNPQTDLGVPLVLSAEVTDAPIQRATVKQVYEQVEKDLQEAIPLLEQYAGNNHVYRLNATAARLLTSRLYLYMGNWDECIRYTNLVLEKRSVLKQLNELKPATAGKTFAINNAAVSPEVIWGYGSSADLGGPPNSAVGTYGAYTISNNLLSTYDAGDLRKPLYFGSFIFFGPSSIVIYIGTSAKAPNSTNNSAKAFRVSEAFLNRAEAYIQKALKGDGASLSKGVDDLNHLRSYRINSDVYRDTSFTDANEAFIFYKAERRRELFYEDHRWYDLRRWGMPAITHTFQVDATVQTVTLPQGDKRYTLPIPREALERNPSLQPNP